MVMPMYFHNGNNQPTTIFSKSECLTEDVFVANLEKGSYLVSEFPYFFIASNGHMSISSQMKSFNYYDSNHILLESVQLTFITECVNLENQSIEKVSRRKLPDSSLLLLMLLIVSTVLITSKRRNKHVKNRFYR
jgi:hypothetical protein